MSKQQLMAHQRSPLVILAPSAASQSRSGRAVRRWRKSRRLSVPDSYRRSQRRRGRLGVVDKGR
ncbi:hypothetical protein SAMD00023353_1401290 [Rosellinia necatrix]|uniref:Uncharacterized protein n=1 Tax=Rosellinia necatrix TaxID=77044 RepID=A0A1S8A725_ROSNE|nr:hypothetical protein SAMD00023353_1401290 [Rosellinia necatrix]